MTVERSVVFSQVMLSKGFSSSNSCFKCTLNLCTFAVNLKAGLEAGQLFEGGVSILNCKCPS